MDTLIQSKYSHVGLAELLRNIEDEKMRLYRMWWRYYGNLFDFDGFISSQTLCPVLHELYFKADQCALKLIK